MTQMFNTVGYANDVEKTMPLGKHGLETYRWGLRSFKYVTCYIKKIFLTNVV